MQFKCFFPLGHLKVLCTITSACLPRSQLLCPGEYSVLESFFEQHKGVLPDRAAWDSTGAAMPTPKHTMTPEMKVNELKFTTQNLLNQFSFLVFDVGIGFFVS